MEGAAGKGRYSDGKLKLVGAWLPVPSPLTGGLDGELALHEADRIRMGGEVVSWTEFVSMVTTPEHRAGKATVYVEAWTESLDAIERRESDVVPAPGEDGLPRHFVQHEVDLQLVGSMRFAFERLEEAGGEGE